MELTQVATEAERKAIFEKYVPKLMANDPATSPEVAQVYKELPWYQQLKYESPFWFATMFVPGATGIRAALAPAAAKGGVKAILPEAARIALAPVAVVEKATAIGLKYGVGLPLKYGVAKPLESGARKAFETALDAGLDKWLLRQGLRGDQANIVIRFFLEKNQRWLYQRAEANWLRRLAEKKGAKYAATKATADTVKEAEPLLLEASKAIGEVKPTAITPPTPKPAPAATTGAVVTPAPVTGLPTGAVPEIIVPDKGGKIVTLKRVVPEIPDRGFNRIKDIELISETERNYRVWLKIEKKYQLIPKSEWQVVEEAAIPKAEVGIPAEVTPAPEGTKYIPEYTSSLEVNKLYDSLSVSEKERLADIATKRVNEEIRKLPEFKKLSIESKEWEKTHPGLSASPASHKQIKMYMERQPEELRKVVLEEHPELEIPKAEAGMPEAGLQPTYPATQAGAEARAKAESISISEASRLNAEEALRVTPEVVRPEAPTALPVEEVAPPRTVDELVAEVPPRKPPVRVEPPPTTSPAGRPRTLMDLNREAKGMRAMTPEQRAAAMDIAKPIEEDEILWKMRPFGEHAKNLLGTDSPIKKALRTTPGWKQVVGVWTPAQIERDNPVAMIGVRKAIFEEIEIGRARTATLALNNDAQEILGLKIIKGVERATKVKPSPKADKTKKLYRTILDLVEHPDHYLLTPEQEKVLRIGQTMMTRNLRDNQRVGVDVVELEGEYWRRMVIKGPKPTPVGQQIDAFFKARRGGAQKGFIKQRVFPLADDLVKAGFDVDTRFLATLQNRLEAGIRSFSDQSARREIAKLPEAEKPLERLGAKFPETLEGQKTARKARDEAKRVYLKEKTVENYITLKQAEADYITAMREVFIKKIEAGQPGYYELRLPNGRIAPQKLVEQVDKYIDLPEIRTGRGKITNTALELTRLVRTTLTNVDLAAGYIQGQVLFYRNNPAWWIAQSKAVISLFDDPYAYVAKNFDLMDEGMRMGAISIPTEFLFSKQGIASIPTRIPGIGKVMRGANRAFEWYIIAGQTELYNATRKGVLQKAMGITPQAGAELSTKATEDLVSLGSAIRKELGTESYAILGVRPTQMMVEQLSFFAARFFRALTGLMGQATSGTAKMMAFQIPNVGEREAMKGMGSLIAGGTALLIAIVWAQDRKLPNFTDPFAPDWMQFRMGNTYFNTFGPFYPYFRTIARMSVYNLQGKPDKAAQELTRFLQGKAGIPYRVVDMAGQFIFTGKAQTFDGEVLEKTPGDIAKGVFGDMMVPISIQEALQAIPEGRYESAIAEIFGLVGRGSPYAQMDIEFQRQKDINPDGLSYRYATPSQEKAMKKRFPDIADMMLRRGQGVYGEASRLWEEIDKLAYAEEIALEEEFLENERTGQLTREYLREFQKKYTKIQERKANKKAGVNMAHSLFQEEKPLPTDPNERALAQYYQMYDKALDDIGEVNWDLIEQWTVYYNKQWTPEQRMYVERNTGLADHPSLIEEYRQAIKDLKPYWETDTDLRMAYRRANPEIDQLLLRWYGYKPATTPPPTIGFKLPKIGFKQP